MCAFTSEVFYENRLTNRPGLEAQRLGGVDGLLCAGLFRVSVAHDGNRNSSSEEVGTVDKFQGQEAPVVIYSMATSRARCVAILVSSPWLLEPECRRPRQMKLANAVCRFREMAGGFRGRESS